MSYFHSGSLFCHPYILTTYRATLQFRCQKIYFGIAIHHWIYTPHVLMGASTPTTLCYQPHYDPLRITTDRFYFDPMCRSAAGKVRKGRFLIWSRRCSGRNGKILKFKKKKKKKKEREREREKPTKPLTIDGGHVSLSVCASRTQSCRNETQGRV